MGKYYVENARISSYARQILEVEAEFVSQAQDLAMKRAPDEGFSTYECEYEISSVDAEKSKRRRRPASTSKADTRNATLRLDMEKLAALVDHYYAAYCEGSVLLERRERELSELRRALNKKPAFVKS